MGNLELTRCAIFQMVLRGSGKSGGGSGGASSAGSGAEMPCPPEKHREPSEPEKGCH